MECSLPQQNDDNFDLENRVREIKSRIARLQLQLGSKSSSVKSDPETESSKIKARLGLLKSDALRSSLTNQSASAINGRTQQEQDRRDTELARLKAKLLGSK